MDTSKSLSSEELKQRDIIIKQMIKNKRKMVKNYGKEAESVIYGRATKILKSKSQKMKQSLIKETIKKILSEKLDIEVGADRYEGEEELSNLSNVLGDLESQLKSHDWYYMMSDDDRKYRAGTQQQEKIRNLMKTLKNMGYEDDSLSLYKEYAPKGYQSEFTV